MKFIQKKPIIFLSRVIDSGSFNLRGIQMSKYLNETYNLNTVVNMKDVKFLNLNPKVFNDSVLYFIKIHLSGKDLTRNTLLTLKQNRNTLIFDMSEMKSNYINLLNDPNIIPHLDLFDIIVVMNNWMKEHILKHTNRSPDSVEVIYHQWDIRISDLLNNNNYLVSPNNQIKYIYNGTEGDTTNKLKTNCMLVGVIDEIEKVPMFDNIKYQDVCFFNLRSTITPFYYFKSNIKLSNASALNSVLITTKDRSLIDLIPNDYPYYVDEENLNETYIRNLMKKVNEDRKQNNNDFQRAKQIMSDVKVNTSIDNIAKQYLKLLLKLNGVKKINKK